MTQKNYRGDIVDLIGREEFLRDIKIQDEKRKKFVESRSYIEVLDKWNNQLEDSGKFVFTSMDEDWAEGDGLTFDLLRHGAFESYHFGGKIVVKYKSGYITFEEQHGQGSIQVITVSNAISGTYVPFGVVENFLLASAKDMRYYSLEVVKRGMKAINSANASQVVDIDGEKMYLSSVWEYLLYNLR